MLPKRVSTYMGYLGAYRANYYHLFVTGRTGVLRLRPLSRELPDGGGPWHTNQAVE